MTLNIASASVREAPPLGQVVFGPITFVAHCERHGIPYFGRVRIGYVPSAEHLCETTLRRMVQRAARYGETAFPEQLVSMLEVCVKPEGIALDIETLHDCVGPRLMDETGARHVASWHGRYLRDLRLRAEFLARCDR